MIKRTRYTRKQVGNGAHHLGEMVAFLKGVKYLAVSKHTECGKPAWYVEVELQAFSRLLDAKRRSLKRKHRVTELKTQLAQVAEEREELKAYVARLEANNATLMRNIENDKSADHFTPSPKSYMNVIQERPPKGNNPLPLQGGLAGLEKKA